MLEPMWWLCDAGRAEEADAIGEFLPEEDVRQLLERFYDTNEQWDANIFRDDRGNAN